MPKVIFVIENGIEKVVEAESGSSILDIARQYDIDLEGTCEGSLACSTCHVVVDEAWYDRLELPSAPEEDMLDVAFGLTKTSRLGCQVIVTDELDGLKVSLPHATRNIRQNTMSIHISAPHLQLGDSASEHIRSALQHTSLTHLPNESIKAEVHLSHEKYLYHCKIIYNRQTKNHATIISDALGKSVYEAFDIAHAKLIDQLRKYKSRLTTSRHHPKFASTPAVEYTINLPQYEEEQIVTNNPVIIAEQTIEILDLNLSEAVMKMELEKLPAIMFRNSDTGRMNTLYQRSDGNLSWIDSNVNSSNEG